MSLLTNAVIGTLVAQFFLAAAGTLSFAILFACPRRLLPYCALVGGVGWLVYELAVLLGADSTTASPAGRHPPDAAHPGAGHPAQSPGNGLSADGHLPAGAGKPVSTTRPIILSRATTRWPFPMVFPLFKIAVVLATGIALVLGIPPASPQALSACFLIHPHIYIHFHPFSA